MKRFAYELALRLLKSTGLMWRETRSTPPQATILGYHGVTEAPLSEVDSPGLHISAEAFRRQMEILAKHFEVIPLEQLVQWLREGEPIPPRSVVLTFDDGYRNNVTCALPILQEFGFPACLFVTAGLVGTQRMHWPDILRRALKTLPEPIAAPLGDSEIGLTRANERKVLRELKEVPNAAREGFIEALYRQLPDHLAAEEASVVSPEELCCWHEAGMEVGSHSFSHPILSRVSPEELARELAESKARLESFIKAPVSFLAYPNGSLKDFNASVIQYAQDAGYEAAVTTIAAHADSQSSLWKLPRFLPEESVIRFEAVLTGFEARVRRLLRRA